MNALIFGINGQDGFYLKKLLLKFNLNVIGISRNNADIIGDVGDKNFVFALIRKYTPTYIFHFAANSTINHNALWENHHAISDGTINILEGCFKYSSHTKVFLSGSGLQFENKGTPISESSNLSNLSPYAVSRNHSLFVARYYRTLGLKIYFGFFFNHDSPRRTNRHMTQKIVSYCKNINKNSEPLYIGDLNAIKEWTYAGDIVEAIWILINQDNIFECVIGSGIGYSVEEWIIECFNLVGYDWKQYIKVDNTFKSHYSKFISNPQLIKSLGWTPKMQLSGLAQIMFNI